jgi:hypothetical protein
VDGELGLTTSGPVTLDLDSSDTEVYGRLKEGVAFNHRGQRSFDSQLATWQRPRASTAAFFISPIGTRLLYTNVLRTFRSLVREAGIGLGAS